MLNLSRAVVRNFATSGVRRATPSTNIDKGYFEVKKIQDHFQKKDGKPVFLKGSAMDQVLYRVTMGLCLVAIGGMGKLFYDLSMPKKE
ncbi:cytochrome c oxidase subunit 7A, mitochondrial-like [Teleopsis dalmanni]|uniref:cytochrome c oxidase subunit 7A, mitochondrial-like n=1 Tax=Teleopsis dalmanni TaxID=139649 RepID=UPI0018CF832C|nr:cytochrome c oxidase subunit 7A, mitochondrial-like [Teleopsis dalmanni]XP_037950177.1 cytochrome c oxidase subunit 7A, mitochondrial-like [Teleopsis dalmanni]